MNPIDYFSQNNLSASNLVAVDKASANLVYLTDDFVLRIVRPELAQYINHEREAVLGLKALNVGIKTAKPIVWDKTYSIWKRLEGQALPNPETCSVTIWNNLLDTLELLHQNPLEPLQSPINNWTGEPRFIEKTQDTAHWTDKEIVQLRTFLSTPLPIKSPCFIHGDAYADNIMVDANTFVGIIDWGNAGWQSLEAECSSMDTPALNLALSRWKTNLDTDLLWKMRLNLSLEVASYGRISFSKVRDILERLDKIGS